MIYVKSYSHCNSQLRNFVRRVFLAVSFVLICANAALASDAFPGAAGHGKLTQGGRDGSIIYVTNLEDSGPGSFRACAEGIGKRNCLFRVGGIIYLKSAITIGPESNNLSILGQTAPGGGITLTINSENAGSTKTPLFIKNTHDVLIRHIRVRPQYPGTVKNADAITIDNSQRVYLDHVSASWATDEVISTFEDATDLTIAYSIMAEGIMPHSKCTLLGSDPLKPQNITFWRNACISNNDRNPDNNHFKGSCVEIANNLFYNARSDWAEIRSQFEGGTTISIVGNYFKAGKNSRKSTYAIVWKEMESVANPTIFQSGNIAWAPKPKSIEVVEPKLASILAAEPPCPIDFPVLSAESAYEDVQANSGAFPRDEVDERVAGEIGPIGREGTGSIKDVAGQLPAIQESTSSYADNDLDGIADAVETQFGGSSGVFDAWSRSGSDGWSNFDKFMQWLSEERISGRYLE